MKPALFSKLSVSAFLVVAGLSGCGDNGSSTSNNGQQSTEPCIDFSGQQCACPPPAGGQGIQTCQQGIWGPCICAGGPPPPGAGGFQGGTGGYPNPGGGQTGSLCGDGQIGPGEQCDGQNQGNQTCASVSMGACQGGYLICTGQCIFDYSACVCGSGAGGQGGSGGTFGTGATTGIGGTTGQP